MKCWNKKYDTSENKGKVYLRLIQDDDDVILALVDSSGDKIKKGNIANFSHKYRVMIIAEEITDKLPLKTDAFGQLITLNSKDYRKDRDFTTADEMPDFLRDLLKRSGVVKVTHKCEDHKHD